MAQTLAARIAELRTLPVEELKRRYTAAFDGRAPASKNKDHIWRRLAFRIQEQEIGGLSDETRARLEEVKSSLDLSRNPLPRAGSRRSAEPPLRHRPGPSPLPKRDRRVPGPGTLIERIYRGEVHTVKVMEKGFEYRGRVFRSLTAIAGEITGSHWNGYHFFRLA